MASQGKENSPVWGEGDEETLEALENQDISGRWLNLAAGDGRYTPELLEKVDWLVASDIDEEALARLSDRLSPAQSRKTEIRVFDLTDSFPFESSSFDGVFCTGTLHLFEKHTLKQVLKEIDRILEPGGKLIFDFATDIERIYPGKTERKSPEAGYTEKEARNFIEKQLSNFKIEWKQSTFEDDLTDNPEYGWKAEGSFLLGIAEKT